MADQQGSKSLKSVNLLVDALHDCIEVHGASLNARPRSLCPIADLWRLNLRGARMQVKYRARIAYKTWLGALVGVSIDARGEWKLGVHQKTGRGYLPATDPRAVREAQTLTESQVVTPWRATFCTTSFLNCQVSLFYMAGAVF
jgi:hypothetical protein